jgi:hypothetical protein
MDEGGKVKMTEEGKGNIHRVKKGLKKGRCFKKEREMTKEG